jgi:UDP:flavonoid glycosyltransferase YjiC (YdhE family)
MRVLLVPLAGGVGFGPLTRALALAEQAHDRGHEVLFLARPEFCPIIARCGFPVEVAPTPPTRSGFSPVAHTSFQVSDDAVALGWADVDHLREAVATERRVIHQFRPDIMYTEYQISTAISSALERVPLACTVSWPDCAGFTSPLYTEPASHTTELARVNTLLAEYGLPLAEDICDLVSTRAQLRLAATTPTQQPELAQLGDVHFVGHLHSRQLETTDPAPSHPRRGRLVYVYLTPGEIPTDTWVPAVLDAFDGTDFEVMVNIAPYEFTPPAATPPNVRFYRRLPGLSVIRHASVVISHGGANTVTAAAMSGVPQLIHSGRYAERDYNGRAIQRLGAGLNLRLDRMNGPDLRTDVMSVDRSASVRSAAQRLGREILSLGGAAQAVSLMERFVTPASRPTRVPAQTGLRPVATRAR